MHGPDTFDCAGLVWYIYHEILGIDMYQDGIGLSTSSKIMSSSLGIINYFEEENINKDLSLIYKGDIVFFHRQSLDDIEPKNDNRYPGHCGIYIGNSKFIHASRTIKQIVISDFEKTEYWTKKLVASKNVITKMTK